MDDDDDLRDDIEDKNASYSDYSVHKAAVSTQNSSRSGNSSTSGNSGSGKKKQKPQKSMFKSLFNRFTKIIGKNKQIEEEKDEEKGNPGVIPADLENFDEQMKRIRVPQERKNVFKIGGDEEVTPYQNDKYENHVTVEEEYSGSSEEDNEDIEKGSGSSGQKGKKVAPEDRRANDPNGVNDDDQEEDEEEEDEEGEEEEGEDDDSSEEGGEGIPQPHDEDDSDEEEYGEENEEESEEDEEEEEDETLEREQMTHCVHRLPFKNQKVNISHFRNVITCEKEPKEPPKKKGIFAKLNSFWRTEEKTTENERFMVFYEGRLVIIKQIPEQARNYGQHFSVQGESDKVQMPQIWWNGYIRSCRSLNDLEKIKLLNYKSVYENNEAVDEEGDPILIKIQLEWREMSDGGKIKTKTYMVEKDGLEMFIFTMKIELKKIGHLDVNCIVS